MPRSRPLHILELRSVRGTGGGPEKTILHGTARTDPDRFAITVCYIRDRRDGVFALGDLARTLGIDYVEIVERHSFDAGVWPALRALVRSRNIDIVHAHDYKTDLLALVLARTERITALATAHGWTGHSRRERLLYYPADRWVLRRLPRIIAVSDEIRRTLIASGAEPDQVLTVLNGIEPSQFVRTPGRGGDVRTDLGLPPHAPVIGSIGRLEPQKRYDVLLHAFSQVRRTNPLARLVIIGDGSQRTQLSTLVSSLGLQTCCTLTGHRSDVVECLHAIDLFVQSSDYEGTPNAVLEAMALETPVVATTAGGTAQLIEDGVHGRLVPCGDPAVLASAIQDALAHPDTLAQWTRAARRRIETELSFEARMRRVEDIYDQLAGAAGLFRRASSAA